MGIPARTWGTQVMCGELVHANQKSPMGRMKEPRIMGGRRSSGITLPCFFSLRAKRVLVTNLKCVSHKLERQGKEKDLHNSHGAEEYSNSDTDEWKSTDTLVPSTLFLEGDRIRLEEQVEDTVNQSHVDCEEDQNRLSGEHVEWPEQVGLNDGFHVNLHSVGLAVNSPVLGLKSDFLCSVLQYFHM